MISMFVDNTFHLPPFFFFFLAHRINTKLLSPPLMAPVYCCPDPVSSLYAFAHVVPSTCRASVLPHLDLRGPAPKLPPFARTSWTPPVSVINTSWQPHSAQTAQFCLPTASLSLSGLSPGAEILGSLPVPSLVHRPASGAGISTQEASSKHLLT